MAKGKGKPAGKKGGGPRAPAARLTPQQLFEQAQIALQYDDFDAARTALRKAAKLEPRNVEIVDALGALLAEVGPEEEAIEVLRRSVALSPDTGYEKYLYLGQLLPDPAEALAATRRGVQVLTAQRATALAAGADDAPHLSKALAAAACSLCEGLLAAAREGEAAGGAGTSGSGGGSVAAVEAEVEALLAQASAADPASPEPGQALAALRYEQGRAEEALQALRASMALWYRKEDDDSESGDGDGGGGAGGKAAAAQGGGDVDMAEGGSGSDEDEGASEEGEEDGTPSYEFRVECAKLLIELDECTATAIDVLEGLIEEDDRVPDAWHLLALAHYGGHEYARAEEALARGRALLGALGAGPDDAITHAFADLEAAIKEAAAAAAQEQAQEQQQQQ